MSTIECIGVNVAILFDKREQDMLKRLRTTGLREHNNLFC